jgi:hypothetical protein
MKKLGQQIDLSANFPKSGRGLYARLDQSWQNLEL